MEQTVQRYNNDMSAFLMIKNGDDKAFEHLFFRYFTPICRFVNTFVNSELIAEELAMDLFASVWEKREYLEIRLTVKSYLFQAARNMTLNYIRDNRRIVPMDSAFYVDLIENDRTVETNELIKLIEEAVLSLPQKCQDIFRLSRYEYMQSRDIAQQMGISTRTVEKHIEVAIKKIKLFIENSYC